MIARSKYGLGAACLASLGVALIAHRLNPYYHDVMLGIGINIILAVSLNLINGYTGQFSLGHAGFMAVGAYASACLTRWLDPIVAQWGSGSALLAFRHAEFAVALLGGSLLAALVGVLVGLPCLRLKGDYLAIATLGFGEIIRVVLNNMDYVGASRGFSGITNYTNFFWTFFVAALTVYIVVNLVNSTYGRGFLAVHDDEVAAEAMGINTTQYKVTAFVVGAFLAGAAGGLFAHFKGYIVPSGFDFLKSIEIVVIVILGGMGNTLGVIIAAILLEFLSQYLRRYGDFRMVAYSLLLVLLMLACPRGLVQVWNQCLGLGKWLWHRGVDSPAAKTK